MSRPLVLVSLGVVLIGGVVAAWQWSSGSEKLAAKEKIETGIPAAKPALIQPRRFSADESIELPFRRQLAANGAGQLTPRQEAEKLEQALEYPLNSRPLHTADLKPERARDRIRPLGGRGTTKYHYSFNGDRLTITDTEHLRSQLVVYSDDAGESPVPLRSVEAELIGPQGSLGSMTYTDSGADGDLRANDHFYGNILSPTVTDLPHGTIVIMAKFVLNDGTQGKAKLSVFHTPTDQVPAKFTGNFTERIEEGSLVTAVEVEVGEAGIFVLEGSIFSMAGAPIARASFRGQLQVGTTAADLLFFGKIFHDAEASGPYSIRDIRGYRFVSGATPNRQLMLDYDGEYETKAYELSVLSDEPWQSSQKSRSLRSLQQRN